MSENKSPKIIVYVCPKCFWGARIRYNSQTGIMVCGHCPYKGDPKDFEQEILPEEGNSDAPAPETT